MKDRKGSEGICHSIVAGNYALPGQLNRRLRFAYAAVGRGGLHCVRHRDHRCFQFMDHKRCPRESAGVSEGSDPWEETPNVTAKDYILLILSMDYVRSGKALAKVMEYSGEAIEELERG